MSIEAEVLAAIKAIEAMSADELEQEFISLGYVPKRLQPVDSRHVVLKQQSTVRMKTKFISSVSGYSNQALLDFSANDHQYDGSQNNLAA